MTETRRIPLYGKGSCSGSDVGLSYMGLSSPGKIIPHRGAVQTNPQLGWGTGRGGAGGGRGTCKDSLILGTGEEQESQQGHGIILPYLL